MRNQIYIPISKRYMGDKTPQTHPELFSSKDLLREVKALLRMNKHFGSSGVRTLAYSKLLNILAERKAKGED